MQVTQAVSNQIGRRAFLKDGVLVLSAGAASSSLLQADDSEKPVKAGLITDLHYADKSPAGSRFYRDTPAKLAEAAEVFTKEKPAFVVELGDFIDAAPSVKTELGYLKKINRDFAAISDHRHYVLGNHCVDTLTKQEFLGSVGQDKSYYSFDSGGVHFVVLDSCFRSDGEPYGRRNFQWTDPNIPAAELDWLREDLKQTSKRTVVFVHQRLDVTNNHGVKNSGAVRKILESSQKVLSVFQGHSHKNDYKEINGIHYCTLVAMVEGAGMDNNGYSLLNIAHDGTIEVTGFRKQASHSWRAM